VANSVAILIAIKESATVIENINTLFLEKGVINFIKSNTAYTIQSNS
jgi:mannose-6-phosphate isomerase class I